MIARTSCSRTSKETSCRAFTPPKESETSSTESSTEPVLRTTPSRLASGALTLGRPLRRRRREGAGVVDREVGGDLAGAPVLVAHLRLDVHRAAAVVERVDQGLVLLADMAAPHLARAGELAVVGIELLVQHDEAVDLRVRELRVLRQVGVHLLDAFT